MRVYDIFKEIIEDFKNDSNVYGILIVGKLTQPKIDYDSLNDIDIFVVINNDYYEREIKYIKNKKIDISYISLDKLNQIIINKNYFMINILAKSKMIYCINNLIKKYIDNIKEIHLKGPPKLNIHEINYLRYKLNDMYEDIVNRKKDTYDFLFLMNNLLNYSLKTYYELNNLWIPKDKKILNETKKIDVNLYNLCTSFLITKEVDRKLKIILKIMNYITKPYGGTLKIFKKGKFPIDK